MKLREDMSTDAEEVRIHTYRISVSAAFLAVEPRVPILSDAD